MPKTSNSSGSVLIVGGGPAGLFAAEYLASRGRKVSVHDHMASVGRKFMLAGRGGLNLTHSEPLDVFLSRYGSAQDVLEPAIRAFGPQDLAEWAAGLGEPTFVGSSGRIFPESFRATPLLRAWLRRLDDLGVDVHLRSKWIGWTEKGDARFIGPAGDVSYEADATLIALGGASWPRVGSDAGWVRAFEQAGIEVEPLRPANGGLQVVWTQVFADKFAGTPIKNIALTPPNPSELGRQTTAMASPSRPSSGSLGVRGELMVTETGVEGGAIYAVGAAVREALGSGGPCVLHVDLQPDLGLDALTDRMTARRRPKDSASTWLRRAGIEPVATNLMREATNNSLPADPAAMASLAKAVPLEIEGLMPIDRAISTAGGIALDAVDDSFMLKAKPGTYVAGEMLDWEAPTGGYLLQATFSTAFVAAHAIDQRLS